MLKNETAGAMLAIVAITIVAIGSAAMVSDPKDLITLIYSNAITAIGSLATGRMWGRSE